MVVKIRLKTGATVRQRPRKNQHVALAMASLLTPAAVMAFALGSWRLTADLNATGQFPITDGLFSHWQVWLTLAGSVQFCASLLNRYGKSRPVILADPMVDNLEEPQRKLVNSR